MAFKRPRTAKNPCCCCCCCFRIECRRVCDETKTILPWSHIATSLSCDLRGSKKHGVPGRRKRRGRAESPTSHQQKHDWVRSQSNQRQTITTVRYSRVFWASRDDGVAATCCHRRFRRKTPFTEYLAWLCSRLLAVDSRWLVVELFGLAGTRQAGYLVKFVDLEKIKKYHSDWSAFCQQTSRKVAGVHYMIPSPYNAPVWVYAR